MLPRFVFLVMEATGWKAASLRSCLGFMLVNDSGVSACSPPSAGSVVPASPPPLRQPESCVKHDSLPTWHLVAGGQKTWLRHHFDRE